MFDHKIKILTAIIFSLTFFASFASAQVCSPTPSGLVAWYPANNDANDISGNDNHGAFSGGSSFAAGQVGQGFNFTGSQNVQVPDDASLDFTSAYTIEMWVAPAAAGLSTGQTFFVSKGNMDFATTQSYGVLFDADRRVHIRVGNGVGINGATSTSQLPLNAFTHIAVTYDGSTLRVYVNGVLEASESTSIAALLNTSEPLVIGGANYGGSSFINAQGIIDEVSLYSRALSDAEITAIFNAGSAGKCQPVVTAAAVSVSGRVLASKNRGVSRARVLLTDADGYTRSTLTNSFGFYRFNAVEVGQTYIFSVVSKRYQFAPQVITVNQETENLNFSLNS